MRSEPRRSGPSLLRGSAIHWQSELPALECRDPSSGSCPDPRSLSVLHVLCPSSWSLVLPAATPLFVSNSLGRPGNTNAGRRDATPRANADLSQQERQWLLPLPHPHRSRKGDSSCRSGPRRQVPYPEEVLERKVVEVSVITPVSCTVNAQCCCAETGSTEPCATTWVS